MIISITISMGSSSSSEVPDTPGVSDGRANRRDALSMQDWPAICQRRVLRIEYVLITSSEAMSLASGLFMI
jgi:hypothetical protein